MIEQIKDRDLRVYAVYLPILPSDKEETVPEASKRLPDDRVSYFWDGKGELVEGYSRAMKFPEGRPAWDMYLLFDRGVEWKSELPLPTFWMHQLRGQPAELLLDGQKLAAETTKLLRAIKK